MKEGKNSYTKEFKLGAAKMVIEDGSKKGQVAKNLGVSLSSLTRWVRDYKKHGSGAFPGKGMLAPADQEKRDLEKQLRRVTMERDLLKKTIAFFAQLDRKGT